VNETPSHLKSVHIHGFRSIRDATFSPGSVSALVGEPGTGKSNLLAALRAALDPGTAPPGRGDLCREGDDMIRITIQTHGGSSMTLEGTPPATSVVTRGDLPPVLFLPARLRAGQVVANVSRPSVQAEQIVHLIHDAVPPIGEGRPPLHGPGSTEAAHGLVHGLESWDRAALTGMILLIEEPELFLPPQTQRYLYRLLRRLASAGNQILYSTHSPSFLNVARIHELVLTEHTPEVGTRLFQPAPLPSDDEFRASSEFDASRSELFLARAAILVEGLTERLALPFVFRALGHDPDRERISIIECGGKSNIPLIGRVSKAVGVPFVAVHDRDAQEGKKPLKAEQHLHQLIEEVAGRENRIELVPDFEGIAGLGGRRNKPARAWKSFAELQPADVPASLVQVVERALAIAKK
jgi:hypothetical protein